MKYFIDQPGCLGDIIFTLNFAEQLSKEAEVYWHISPVFWENGINRIKSPAIMGPNIPRRIQGSDKVFDLCDMCNRNSPELMRMKYTHFGYDWSRWADSIKFDRNLEIEDALKKHFNLEEGEPFIFYNDSYGFGNVHKGVVQSIPENYDGKVIKLNVFENISILDWCWIFENAEQIITVDTSILMIIETLELKAKKMIMHPRHYKRTMPQLESLYSKPWEWVEYDRDTWRELCPQEPED